MNCSCGSTRLPVQVIQRNVVQSTAMPKRQPALKGDQQVPQL